MANERSRSRLVRVAAAVAILVAAAALTLMAFGGKSYASAAAYYYAGKVTICHHAGPHGKTVTITVGAAAVPAHVRNHGDTMGPCP